jgi:hypothetical protein
MKISKKLDVKIKENLYFGTITCLISGSSFYIVFDIRDNLNRSQNQVVLQ